jgi:hypothetical protein
MQPRDDARTRNAKVREAIRTDGLRRVYVLPCATVDRIAAYQVQHLLPSEAAAFRELLDLGLTKAGHPRMIP